MQIVLALAVSLLQIRGATHPRDSRIDASPTTRTVLFVGTVTGTDGLPARGAVVGTSAGGEALAAEDGRYELVVDVPCGSTDVEVTAHLEGARADEYGSASLAASALTPVTTVGLVLLPSPSCHARWRRAFPDLPGVDGSIGKSVLFDDGTGPALYVTGGFDVAGGLTISNFARWDGAEWSTVPGAMDGLEVSALAVFAGALYAGGSFTSVGGAPIGYLARWDGVSWSAVGPAMDGPVSALEVVDDGGGPALFAGGAFTHIGGVLVNRVARWDGASWSPLGSGLECCISALAAFDDGSGVALCAARNYFVRVAGQDRETSRIERWDGSQWTSLPGEANGFVFDLTAFDDGTGPALYEAGSFTSVGGSTANRVAKWDGSVWSRLGIGVNDDVFALEEFDDGSGRALYVGGAFSVAGNNHTLGVARWDGTRWSNLGGGASGIVRTLTPFQSATGPALYVAGSFGSAGGLPVAAIAVWDSSWSALSLGAVPGPNVRALRAFDDGRGPALYAAGDFEVFDNVARWDGSSWEGLAGGLPFGHVEVLEVADLGGGSALYLGGSFDVPGGLGRNIARWDGASWSGLASGVDGPVLALAVFDAGGGPALFAGGRFTAAGGTAASRIAKWDGQSWSPLGSGVGGVVNVEVRALAVFDDGTGPALYVGGTFGDAGGHPAGRFARWDGTRWSRVSASTSSIHALAVFDDGAGPRLYAAVFDPTSGVQRWNGQGWDTITTADEVIHVLSVHDDGDGARLYGAFAQPDGAAHVRRWDGTAWQTLPGVFNRSVDALAGFDRAGGPALYVGGAFSTGPSRDSYLTSWTCSKVSTSGPTRP